MSENISLREQKMCEVPNTAMQITPLHDCDSCELQELIAELSRIGYFYERSGYELNLSYPSKRINHYIEANGKGYYIKMWPHENHTYSDPRMKAKPFFKAVPSVSHELDTTQFIRSLGPIQFIRESPSLNIEFTFAEPLGMISERMMQIAGPDSKPENIFLIGSIWKAEEGVSSTEFTSCLGLSHSNFIAEIDMLSWQVKGQLVDKDIIVPIDFNFPDQHLYSYNGETKTITVHVIDLDGFRMGQPASSVA